MKSSRWLTIIGILILLSIGVGAFWCFRGNPFGQETINIYIFYSEDDRQSRRAKTFVEDYVGDNEEVQLFKYDVWNDPRAREIIGELDGRIGIKSCAIPLVVIGENGVIGYVSDSDSGQKIVDIIENCGRDCYSNLDEIEKIEFEYEPSTAPINKPDDENKGADVC